MTTTANKTQQTQVALLENTIAELNAALENLGEVEPCSYAERQQTAILDDLAAAQEELERLEGEYYNHAAEGYGF